MNEKITIFLVEDDAIIRATLQLMLENKGFLVVGEADEAEVAYQQMEETKPDLAILDINLIGTKDGIWLAHKLRENMNLPFIFLTAYSDDATMSSVMQTKPNGFLTKPFKEADVFLAVHIAIESFSKNEVASITEPNPTPSENMMLTDCVFIKEKQLLIKVLFKDIIYLKSDGNYVEYVTKNKKYLVRAKLNTVLDKLPTGKFIQVHQRFLVRISSINQIGTNFLIIDKEKIPVSKTYAKNLLFIFKHP